MLHVLESAGLVESTCAQRETSRLARSLPSTDIRKQENQRASYAKKDGNRAKTAFGAVAARGSAGIHLDKYNVSDMLNWLEAGISSLRAKNGELGMKLIICGLALAAMSFTASGCQVNKTQEGKMPKVAVKTSGGQMPAYNVEGPDVNVGSKTETVKVPTVQVTTPGHKSH